LKLKVLERRDIKLLNQLTGKRKHVVFQPMEMLPFPADPGSWKPTLLLSQNFSCDGDDIYLYIKNLHYVYG
jgi:hypothetical protein